MVANAIPTLRSITVQEYSRRDDGKVVAIISTLIQQNPVDQHVSPLLTKIVIAHSSTSVKRIGAGMFAGLFPALQSLTIANCHANKGHMNDLIQAVAEGRVSALREVIWDGLAGGEKVVSNLMLEAFSRAKCPEIELLSFIDNRGFDQTSLSFLTATLTACPRIREVRMDTTMTPAVQLQEFIVMLNAGNVPRLGRLEIRLPSEVALGTEDGIMEQMKTLEQAGPSRVGSPVHVLIRLGKATLNSWVP